MVRGRRIAVLAVAFVLHGLALLWMLRGRVMHVPAGVTRYTELVFIAPPKPVVKPRPIPAAPVSRPTAPPRKTPVSPAPVPESNEPIIVAQTPAPDPFAAVKHLDVDALVKQAGQADRDTRPAGENAQYGPLPSSMQAVLDRAFTEAKLAVPLKWYEAARVELFSAPNDPAKIYQVKTAFFTYCLFYPDPRKISGAASSGPKVGNCPHRF